MIKILIVDDHTLLRKGIRRLLIDCPDVKLVEEASNAVEAIEKVTQRTYDLVILDIAMPGRDGIDLLKQLRREFPKVATLVLSMYPEDHYAVRVMKAGASGYLTKEKAPEELIAAIRHIAAGKKFITPSLAELLANDLEGNSDRPLHELLSDREYQVLRELAMGKTVGEIATDLSISVKTVSTYRSRILQKTGMKSNASLIHYALKEGLID